VFSTELNSLKNDAGEFPPKGSSSPRSAAYFVRGGHCVGLLTVSFLIRCHCLWSDCDKADRHKEKLRNGDEGSRADRFKRNCSTNV